VTDPSAGLPAFPLGATVPSGARALVLTVSDGVSSGTRQDESGVALGDRLVMAGFRVDRETVADDREAIGRALVAGAAEHNLVISTGGTGLTPRDVTPQATLAVIDYEVPGLAEAMRAAGRSRTPMADLSRGVVGVIGHSLVVNVPGSPRAALESLVALEPTLPHALETLSGPFDHSAAEPSESLLGSMPVPPLAPLTPFVAPASETTSAASQATPASPAASNDPWRDLPRTEDRS
jgi:molybdenum cofactor synthesis domain-containing protein